MMRKFTHKIISLSLFALATHCCSGSNPGIALTLLNYTIQNTQNNANLGYTITINATVTNYDSVPFNGNIDFGLHNDVHILSGVSNVFGKPPYSGNQISLATHETVPAVFSVHLDPAYFTPGPDVVVVWPISSAPIQDSVVINFTIYDPTGIADNSEPAFGYIVLNNTILLKGLSPETNFKQVRIYNLLGQQLSEQRGNAITEINVPTLPKGIYLCELITDGGKRSVIKFFH